MIARRTLGSLWILVAACGDAVGATGEVATTDTGGTTGGSFPGTTGAPPTSGTSGAPTGETSGDTTAPTSSETGSSSETTIGSETGSTGSTGTTTGSSTGPGGSTETGPGGSTETGPGGSTETGASTDTGSSTETGTSESGSSSDTGGVCGDGVVDAGEECDDGDKVDDDECSDACVLPSCSDGQENGGETAVDCGGPCPACPFALLYGGNAGQSVGAWFDGAGWTSSDILAPTVDGVGLTITGDATGVAVFRYTKIGDPKDNQLQYVTWKAGVWSQPQQIGQDTTRAAPTIARVGDDAQVVFHGENFQFYYARFDGMAWAPAAEMVGSFGPGPGSVTTLGGDALLVFHDGGQNNRLTSRRRVGVWQAGAVVDNDGQMFDRQAAIVALAADEALVVHARNAGGQLRWSVGPGGWSAPADVAGAQTSAPPALAATGAGEAALAFRGTDGRLYVADFDGATWLPAMPVANPNPTIFGAPALARGIGGAELELLYLDAGAKTIRHTRRTAGVWSAPVQVGNTALERVAIASGP